MVGMAPKTLINIYAECWRFFSAMRSLGRVDGIAIAIPRQ